MAILYPRADRISKTCAREISKGWGKEVIFANQSEQGYCGKLLVYEKAGSVSSLHFHRDKHETFYVLNGRFNFKFIIPETAEEINEELKQGDVVVIPPCCSHQVTCLEAGTILEASTRDSSYDNYRVAKGDSQTKGVDKV